MKPYLFCFLLLGFATQHLPVQAKEYVFDLYYKRDIAVLDTQYRTNRTVMKEIRDLIHNRKVDSVAVVSLASPEGERNQKLASNRSYHAESFVLWLQSQVLPIKIGEDYYTATWASVIPIIETDSKVPYRKELLQIIAKEKSERAISAKVRKLGSGKLMTYLDKNALPHLRKSIVTVYCAD